MSKATKGLSHKKLYKMCRESLENMCFCKRKICDRCTYVEEMPDRCKNEQVRDKLFHAIALYIQATRE